MALSKRVAIFWERVWPASSHYLAHHRVGQVYLLSKLGAGTGAGLCGWFLVTLCLCLVDFWLSSYRWKKRILEMIHMHTNNSKSTFHSRNKESVEFVPLCIFSNILNGNHQSAKYLIIEHMIPPPPPGSLTRVVLFLTCEIQFGMHLRISRWNAYHSYFSLLYHLQFWMQFGFHFRNIPFGMQHFTINISMLLIVYSVQNS